jgi:hypothetical protein
MANLVDCAVESHEGAGTVVLYFDVQPSDNEIKEAFASLYGELGLSVDVNDQFYCAEVVPTPISECAGLVRVVGYPAS